MRWPSERRLSTYAVDFSASCSRCTALNVCRGQFFSSVLTPSSIDKGNSLSDFEKILDVNRSDIPVLGTSPLSGLAWQHVEEVLAGGDRYGLECNVGQGVSVGLSARRV